MQILAGVVLLAILIVFHELGHFWVAKMLGVRVLTFSLGFGPKLASFKHGDTEYRLSLIPLGGYVRMFGESLEEDLSEDDKKISFMHQATWRKSLIAAAGPIFNFILPVVLLFGLLVGREQIYLPVVGTVLKGSVAEQAGLIPDDRIQAVNQEPTASFNDFARIVSDHPGQELALSIIRPSSQGETSLVIKLTPESKPSGNPLEKDQKVGRVGVMPAILLPIIWLDENNPLSSYGLKSLDQIVEINKRPIKSSRALFEQIGQLNESPTLKVKRDNTEFSLALPALGPDLANNHWGIASAMGAVTGIRPESLAERWGLKSGDRVVSINHELVSSSYQLHQQLIENHDKDQAMGVITKAGESKTISLRLPDNFLENPKLDADLASMFGIESPEMFKPGEILERSVGIVEALGRAVSQTYAIAAMTGKSLWLLAKGDVPASQVGGPIQLFDVAQQAANKGLAYYIFIMCLLSVNLGLLNLLPIPALDGGHLLLFGIEAIQRRPLTVKTRTVATQIGFALLLCLMALAIFNDLSRLFR